MNPWRRFRDLPLVWKLLLPLVTGALVLGLLGSFLIVNALSSRAQTALDEDLFRRSVVVDARVRDQAVYLVEAVRFGANIEGLAETVRDRDLARLRSLVAAVPATRPQLDVLVVTDRAGRALVQLERKGGRLELSAGADWSTSPLVARVQQAGGSPTVDKQIGLQRVGPDTTLAVAAPLRLRGPIGVILAAVRVDAVASRAAEDIGGPVGFFLAGDPIGRAGTVLPAPAADLRTDASVRRVVRIAGKRTAVSYSPVRLNGEVLATLAVGVPTATTYASVGGARTRLLALVAVALAGLIAFGAFVNHLVLRQVRPLVALNRALGRGDLTARTSVLANDELGELAAGFNLMAEQLEAAHTEAEHRVTTRTADLERLYRELEELSTDRLETFAALNHEFRNDLVGISGYAELMCDPRFDDSTPGWRQEFGSTIRESVRTALDRVTEALDLARYEGRTIELSLEDDVQVGDLLEELRPTVVALARRAELDVDWSVDPKLPAVTADRRQLREVAMNLASNAVKYTPGGGTVRVAAKSGRGHIAISVKDTGVGIPQDDLAHLFKPFYRVEGTSPQRGEASSGVGLAHVKRVVEAHRGTVEVVSEVGKGSTFTVRLPR